MYPDNRRDIPPPVQDNTEETVLTAYALGASRIDVAQVRCAPPNRPGVLFCASIEQSGATPAAFKQIKARMPRRPTLGMLLLARGQYQLHQVEAPKVPREECAQAVRWLLQDQLDFPAEEACVDVVEVPSDPRRPAESRQVFVVCARAQLIRAQIEACHGARLPLSIIDVPEMAARNLAHRYEADERSVGLLTLTDEGSLLTFTHRGELLVAREFDVTLAQVLEASGENFEPTMERMALEIQRTCDHVDRRFHYAGVARVLISPLPKGLGVMEYLSANLSVRVQQMDLNEILDLSAIPDARDALWQARQLPAIGAALRELPLAA